ncbi:hydroquinone glucosyltransferase-like [Actinidia eriantha]|uniref:hydroquinone glucosyltransferase-like n=1 Tax=Actinidia eriantha TaxID=165200 RepID=UPI0025866678|nr:hydroquinone glucosyltransferase-like [Actinidia eriantha]
MENCRDLQKPHIVILPIPGMGHLIPLIEFANRLIDNYGFAFTIVIPSFGFPMMAIRSFLETIPKTIDVVYLPQVSFDDHPNDVSATTRIMDGAARCIPALRDLVNVLKETTRLVALLVDVTYTDTFDVAKEFGLLQYIFVSSSAMSLSTIFYMLELDETCSCEHRELTEPVKIPGCVSLQIVDLPIMFKDRKNETYKWILYHARRYILADGLIVNSFLDLEPGALKVLMEESSGKPVIYPIGPLLQSSPTGVGHQHDCLRWLDEQPPASVLLICFGSSGTISPDQITELAFGLEMSGQRFLWVLRIPSKNAANGIYFKTEGNSDSFDFLPKGFLDRTKGIGLVIASWAPQIQILSHGSTGGFLSHCGWNSILEGVVHGVPFLAWPLFAEQDMNAVMLSEDLKIALQLKKNKNELVGREEIAKGVKGLIAGQDGKLIRKRVRDLKDAAAMATSQDGSSTKSISKIIEILENHKTKLS